MRTYIGITDGDWHRFLSTRPDLEELNFWQPGGSRAFRRLAPGGPFLFKLHSPRNFIVGGGFFAHWTRVTASLAWEAFGEKNGAETVDEIDWIPVPKPTEMYGRPVSHRPRLGQGSFRLLITYS